VSLSAEGPADRVEQLANLTERLTEQLKAELKAFEARRPHELANTTPQTLSLANLYRRESQKVKADPNLITGAPAPLTARLRKATEAFEATLTRHAQAMQAAKTLTEGLVRAIAAEIQRQKAPVSVYDAKARSTVAQAIPITLNRRA
jgi:ribosomal protein S25